MKINAEFLVKLRNKKGWSQEELSIATGLNLRTIQRIESEAVASLQSRKALASVFKINIHDLNYVEKPIVKKYEYKTVEMPFRFGIVKRGVPDIEKILGAEGAKGWRLLQIVMPSDPTGGSEQMVAILEREKHD